MGTERIASGIASGIASRFASRFAVGNALCNAVEERLGKDRQTDRRSTYYAGGAVLLSADCLLLEVWPMSRALDYPAVCRNCRRTMSAGTIVEFDRIDGEYVTWHAGACPGKTTGAKRQRRRFDLRECGTDGCYGQVGLAFAAGLTPTTCPHCGGRWVWAQNADDQQGVWLAG